MGKNTKDATASAAKKEAKVKAPADPNATKNLIRLLNILALLLAITAFIFQFFAVISHNWKWQTTNLHPIFTGQDRPVAANVYDDSRIEQRYGLFSRHVKVYAHHDEQLEVLASTRFPRLDNDDSDLHQCLSQTSTYRGSLLACSDRIKSPGQCHCRRYPHWNAIIFFEITALILLGLVVAVSALLTTQYHSLLKLIGVALSFIAFLFLLLGLILLLSYVKRETRTISDTFPHTHTRLVSQIAQRHHFLSHKVVRRQAQHEKYRAYALAPGQHPFNDTHYQQYSEELGTWIQLPYTSMSGAYHARSQQAATQRTVPPTTPAPLYNAYGPLLGYNEVYENTRACIGWSTVLSIFALLLALAILGVLAFSWLSAKKLGPEVQTITTTTIKTEYVPGAQDVNAETVPLTQSAITDETRQTQVVIHDVVVREEQPATTQSHHA